MRLQAISARNNDLHERCLADPRWVLLEESVKCQQLLRQPFDAVQTVNAHNDFLASELVSHTADRILDSLLPQPSVELRGLDADGESLDGDGPVVVGHGESI